MNGCSFSPKYLTIALVIHAFIITIAKSYAICQVRSKSAANFANRMKNWATYPPTLPSIPEPPPRAASSEAVDQLVCRAFGVPQPRCPACAGGGVPVFLNCSSFP